MGFPSLKQETTRAGLQHAGLQACTRSVPRQEEEAGVRRLGHQWLNGRGEFTHRRQGPAATPHRVQRTGSSVCLWGRNDHQLSRTDLRLAHWLPGKPASLTAPQANNLHRADVFPLVNYHSGAVLI